MRHQGQQLSIEEAARIRVLLQTTEMSIPEIAVRMGCSRTAVNRLNRIHKVRAYLGRRSTWTLNRATPVPVET